MNDNDPLMGWINPAVEYDCTCDCGEKFKQHPLSRRWLDRMKAKKPEAYAKIVAEIPGKCVPIHCPKCERRELNARYTPPEFHPLDRVYAAPMHKGRFTQRLLVLAEMFGRNLSAEATGEYYRALSGHMSWDDFDRACSNISRSEMRFMPKPGEILAAARHGAA